MYVETTAGKSMKYPHVKYLAHKLLFKQLKTTQNKG